MHNNGSGAKYLKGKRPVKLVYAKEFRYYKNAINEERFIKKLSRKKKEERIKEYHVELMKTSSNGDQKKNETF